jgi:hypothetical protein
VFDIDLLRVVEDAIELSVTHFFMGGLALGCWPARAAFTSSSMDKEPDLSSA